MSLQELEGAADAGEHAECQHVDLHETERVDIVLVPFDEGALVHRGVADRYRLVEPFSGEHEAADVLREVPRKTDELGCNRHGLTDRWVVWVEPRLADVVIG